VDKIHRFKGILETRTGYNFDLTVASRVDKIHRLEEARKYFKALNINLTVDFIHPTGE